MDFLHKHDFELSAKGHLKLNGYPLQCEIQKQPIRISRVSVKCDTVIPANSECIVEGIANTDSIKSRFSMVSSKLSNDNGNSILVGRTLVDHRRTDIGLPIRLLNLSSEEILLRKGSNIAQLHEVEDITINNNSNKTPINRVNKLATSQHGTSHWPEPLVELYNRSITKLDSNCKEQLHAVLDKYVDVFAKSPHNMGRTSVVTHTIDTGSAKPIKQQPRRPPMAFAADERSIIEEQLKAGVIKESTSPWASPCVYVKKRDGSTRQCIDYRRLNEVTRKDAYPLPRVSDCLDSICGAKYFSTLDLQTGYWQIEVAEEDKPKTAFVTRDGLFEYQTMPFGLCNGTSSFQHCMELVLRGLQWDILLIYLDDVILFSSTIEDHIRRLDQVFARFQKAGLKLKPSKCELLQEEVVFLGHLVTQDGLKPDKSKTKVVQGWPIPRNITDVRSFLGLCSYYRKFVPHFSTRAGPLTQLLEAGQEFQWSSTCQEAFEDLKAALTGNEIMAYPCDDGLYILDTDASDTGVGATLSQWSEKWEKYEERPLVYASKSLTKTQRRYCVTRRELLAIVTFVQQFRHFLLGKQFLIRTDHSALRWIMSFKEPVNQMARWLEILSQFDFKIEHRDGKKHRNAVALSRIPCEPDECMCYNGEDILESLPCGGCEQCKRKHADWSAFMEIDNVVPLGSKQQEDTKPTVERWSRLNRIRRVKSCFNSCVTYLRFLAVFIIASVLQTIGGGTSSISNGYRFMIRRFRARKTSNKSTGSNVGGGSIDDVSREDCQYSSSEVDEKSGLCCWMSGMTLSDICKLQENDPDIGKLFSWKKSNGARPERDQVASESPSVRQYWLMWDQIILKSGVLYKKWVTSDGSKPKLQLLVPLSLRKQVLEAVHDSVTSGHLGVQKTISRARQVFYWYMLQETIRDWIRNCNKRGSRKRPLKTPTAKNATYNVGAPMDRLAIDILDPFPQTERDNKYVLVAIDRFTKWVEAYAIPNFRAETVANKLVYEFISRFGVPLDIDSDQGRNFESKLFTELCALLEVNKTRTSPYHPAGNGMVERFNRTLVNMI